jgi:two-component system OmpR family sensor kinase
MLESVRVRLTLWYTAALALVFVVLAAASYFLFWQNILQRTDSDLIELSSAFLTTLNAELEDQKGPDILKGAAQSAIVEHRFRDYIFIVLDSSGGALISSLDLPTAKSAPETVPSGFLASAAFRDFARAALRGEALYQNVPGEKSDYRGYARHFPVRGQTQTLIVLRSLRSQRELLEEITATFAWVMPLAILLASGGGYFLARKSLAPVVEMATQAGHIGAATLHERLAVRNEKDELGHLARAFNELLDRLDQSFERQRRFMADASHELRTPVAILRGEAEVALSQPSRTPEEYRDSLGVLLGEAQRLTRIVEDLFTMARADAGQYPLEPRDFYLDDLAADCVHSARTLALAKNITLRMEPAEESQIRADEALVRRMLLNLLDNAIKYTPPGGQVSLSCKRLGEQYALSVTDTGEGIPAEMQPRIFERFFRADTARARADAGGAGLGLSIAKWIAEAHDGRLELTRTGAAGSAFTAYLPVTAKKSQSLR